eukprot:Seg968.4 transcript_id=Seg968.4/GoldUCD/mRNA.D3Y31 product="hypothetical protein" protein_id=Seg968.4/GoldUCD/D3Y31
MLRGGSTVLKSAASTPDDWDSNVLRISSADPRSYVHGQGGPWDGCLPCTTNLAGAVQDGENASETLPLMQSTSFSVMSSVATPLDELESLASKLCPMSSASNSSALPSTCIKNDEAPKRASLSVVSTSGECNSAGIQSMQSTLASFGIMKPAR